LGNYAFFRKEFITPIEKNRDEQRSRRLRSLVQPYLLRRTKEEVARDLPPLTTKLFYSEMTAEQKKIYEKEKSAARNALLDSFDAHNPQYKLMVLQSLTRLRQLVNHPGMVLDDYPHESGKYNDVLEHWDIIRRSGHKALFFSSFVKYLDYFKQHFESQELPYAWLSGDIETRKRAEQVRRFEEQPAVQSFLISIKAGGAGLNLTAADYVFILDPWWNPATEQQAIARAHRIGQDKHVIAVKFITKDSIEEKIMTLQAKKAQLADDIINANEQLNFSKDEIGFLLS
jgi:non-specific serine/threonine protein kinase